MKPPRPSALVTLAGRTLNAAQAGLVSIRIGLSTGSHDVVEMAFWPSTKFASAATGDAMSVQLGFEDEEEDVWSGEVTAVERTPSAILITGHAPTLALSRERRSQTYVDQKVSQIVRDLASAVTVDEVKADAALSYYAVDHRRSVWGHLLDLASLSGSEILLNAQGGLRFVPVNTLPSTTRFRYGAEVLDWRLGPSAVGEPPKFAAHGAASEAGSEKWHWVNSDPTGGAGESQVTGGFQSKSLAEDLSKAVAAQAKRSAVQGEVELVGQQTLRPGDIFSLSDMDADPGPLRALSVVHSIDGVRGFRTLAQVEGAGGGGAGGLL